MCDQLPALARALGREATAAVIFPEILELAADEEAAVRASAVAALGAVLPLLPQELRRGRALPFLRGLCGGGGDSDAPSEMRLCVARLLGDGLVKVLILPCLPFAALQEPWIFSLCCIES
jgi:hypothetical protein